MLFPAIVNLFCPPPNYLRIHFKAILRTENLTWRSSYFKDFRSSLQSSFIGNPEMTRGQFHRLQLPRLQLPKFAVFLIRFEIKVFSGRNYCSSMPELDIQSFSLCVIPHLTLEIFRKNLIISNLQF